MFETKKREVTRTIDNCPHTDFNGGYQHRCEGCGHTRDYILGYAAGQDDWIPVSERLPDAKDKQAYCLVTVLFDDGDSRTALSGYWNDAGWSIEHMKEPLKGHVVAWMPRPKPYISPAQAEETK